MGFWKLSPVETVGVVAVGAGLTWVTGKAVDQVRPGTTTAALAALAGGTALYTLGVVIGSNRPAKGWAPLKLTGPTG